MHLGQVVMLLMGSCRSCSILLFKTQVESAMQVYSYFVLFSLLTQLSFPLTMADTIQPNPKETRLRRLYPGARLEVSLTSLCINLSLIDCVFFSLHVCCIQSRQCLLGPMKHSMTWTRLLQYRNTFNN